MPNERRDRLLQMIHEAFADVRLGGGVTLHEATAIDDHASPAERQAARRLDAAERWQDVPDEHIERNSSVFSFLDVEGHRFYAPAYMCWLLRTGHDTASNSTEAAQQAFHPWGVLDGASYRKPHDIYTPAQCRAIAHYLLYVYEVLDEEGCSLVKESLDRYWRQYL
ncbi:DUF6714 family protein [Roseateles cellulosilyticus]|uniref:Uncharacterized protein n=1 Tax=Pelomonas cellulosilytica TaxID=2906762 RepID=A0ABS8XPW6_9BURK|nr:DUF6714 family protein [Pelomonas sp. P8]MCE4554794.1 hypothetical protein [Pelomonas sp. P8]